MKLFLLSKENIELAKDEILSLAISASYELENNLLIVGTENTYSKRLAYTHKIYAFLFRCRKEELINKINNFNWQQVYKENFCVRAQNMDEKTLASLIHARIKSARVNLSTPKTIFRFFQANNVVFATRFLSDTDKSYNYRKAHHRPKLHPTSLDPKLARACINLTGLKSGRILDPFCGFGGILIEAGIMGFNLFGADNDPKQIQNAKINLNYYNLMADLKIDDARITKTKCDAIVTDLPYGKNSKASYLEKLYIKFLSNSENLTKNMIIIFPNYVNPALLISKTRWKIKSQYKLRIHKSLTRIIFKLYQD